VLHSYTEKIVKQSLNDPNIQNRNDLLAHFIRSSDVLVTPTYLRDMLLNFMIAGRDTTGVLLTWTLYFLSRHPEVEEKVVQELKQVHQGRPVTAETVTQLEYLKQVLNETLRLCPPVPNNVRRSVKEDTLPNGYHVPANCLMLYSAFQLHRLPELWGEDARIFDPDRWSPERVASRKAFFYVPFHAGPRTCLGQSLALTEAKVLIAMILPRFRFRLVPGHRVAFKPALILTAKNGMPVEVTMRETE